MLALVAALLLLTGCQRGLRGEDVPDRLKFAEERR